MRYSTKRNVWNMNSRIETFYQKKCLEYFKREKEKKRKQTLTNNHTQISINQRFPLTAQLI